MVALGVAVPHVAGAVGELADVPALEGGAGRQDDVGELGFSLHPDGLGFTHERQLVRLIAFTYRLSPSWLPKKEPP